MEDHQIEEWRPTYIMGDKYEVSNLGRVRSIHKVHAQPRIMKTWLINGYEHVPLFLNGKRKNAKVHRLVLAAFSGPPPPGYAGAHLNGKRNDNNINNLAWKTYKENEIDKDRHGRRPTGERHYRSKLTQEQVDTIRRMPNGKGTNDLARAFGVHRTHIRRVRVGEYWRRHA